MAYGVELAESVDRELDKLDPQQRKRILKFLHGRVARLDDPRIGAGIDRLGPTRMYRPYDHLGEAHLRTHSRRGRVS